MIRNSFGIVALFSASLSLLSLSSCAHNTHLISIAIQPGDGTFAAVDPNASFQYKAYGTYKHPPKTVDITDKVTWQSSAPQVAQFTAPGMVSPNTNCGVAQIFATMHDNPNDIVSNQVSITVDGPESLGCPQGTATHNLSINVTAGAADGVITSAPPGITCGATCVAAFSSNSTVTLTAAPIASHNFTGWASGCSSSAGTSCQVTMTGDIVVSASFD